MKVWIVNVKKLKKLVVKVVWFENGKQKIQTKESFNYNEKKKAEALKIKLQNQDKIDAVDQKITFKDAFNSYIKTLEQGTLNIPEYIDTQVGYINNHVAPYIKRTLGESKIDIEYLSDYTMADFKYTTLPLILASKKVAWRSKDGKEYYIRLKDAIGKKVVKEVIGELKKFLKYCADNDWKFDYKILTFTFQKNYFTNYTKKKMWMPKPYELLEVVNKEKDIKLKTLYTLSAEAGPRANEAVAACVDDIDFVNGTIDLNHSLGKKNNFRPYFLKTGIDARDPIIASDKLLTLLDIWIKTQIFPKTLRNVVCKDPNTGKTIKRNFVRIFDFTKKTAAAKVKQSAKKLGIDWKSGLSPFRKWSTTMATDLKDQNGNPIFTEKQLDKRFGNTKEIRDRHYTPNLNLNEKQRRTAINQLTKG